MREAQASPEMVFGVLGVLLLCVFPLSVHDYSSITRFKYQQMLLLTGVSLLSTAVFWRSWKDSFEWRHLPRCLCAAYAVWVILSSFLGSYASMPGDGGLPQVFTGAIRYEGLITQLCYVLLFMVFSLSRPHKGMVLGTCAIAVTVYAALTLCQYAGYNVLELFPRGRSIRTNYEFQGTIGNIDMVSGYLILMIPLLMISYVLGMGGGFVLVSSLLGVLLETMMEVQSGLLALAVLCCVLVSLALLSRRVRTRAGMALAGICLCFALRRAIALPWLDGTEEIRAVWRWDILLWLAGACLSWLAGHFFQNKTARTMRPGQVLLLWTVLAVIAVLAVWLVPFSPESGAVWEAHEILNGRSSDSFGSWRWGVWRCTLASADGHLLMGTGPDMFYYAMRDYLAKTGTVLGETFDNPHNLYLAILSGSGLPALVIYLALLVCIMVRALREEDAFQRALGISVLLYSIQGFFSFSICLVSPMAWTVFGMACAGKGKDREVQIHDLCE